MPRFAVRRDDATAGFFDGTARGEFLLVQDTQTGEGLGPQFDTTVDPESSVSTCIFGTGTVVRWVVVNGACVLRRRTLAPSCAGSSCTPVKRTAPPCASPWFRSSSTRPRGGGRP